MSEILPMSPRVRKLALASMGAISAGGSVLSGLSVLVQSVGDSVAIFAKFPTEYRWIIAGVLLLFAIICLLAALSRRSILREPQHFLLSADNPKHLVGREEEVEHLIAQCRRYSMVFLVGDSGSGKSALVKAGVAEKLLACRDSVDDCELVPLVLDLSGLRWERGIELALVRALARISDEHWQKLGGGERPEAGNIFFWMRDRPVNAPRRLLLILDQFDDYLAAHRSYFYDGNTLCRPEELEARSVAWHGLAQALRAGSSRVLVVSRSETGGSFPALSFVGREAIVHEQLTRLPGTLIAPLLNRLDRSADNRTIISDPEFGWNQLRSRLLRDLEAAGEGEVLPIQLAISLNSLRLYRYLTTASYERTGGLRGLERLHVERHAQKAATAGGIQPNALLEVLLCMISSDGSKTKPVQRQVVSEALTVRGVRAEDVDKLLVQLEKDKLLRRVPSDHGGSEALLLYHDYLARGIREAYSYANRWSKLLRQRSRLFEEATGWLQRWRELLSPFEQLRLLWERMRGRFHFGDDRKFLAFSAVRWLPWALGIILVGFVIWEVQRVRQEQVAAEVAQALGHVASMTREEARQIERLERTGTRAAMHLIRLALDDPATASRAVRRVDQLTWLASGFDPEGEHSRHLMNSMILPELSNAEIDSACLAFAAELASRLRVSDTEARSIARQVIGRLKAGRSDDDSAVALVGALASLSPRADSSQVREAFEIAVEMMAGESYQSAGRWQIADAIERLSRRLDSHAINSTMILEWVQRLEHQVSSPGSVPTLRAVRALGGAANDLTKAEIIALLFRRASDARDDSQAGSIVHAVAEIGADVDLEGTQAIAEAKAYWWKHSGSTDRANSSYAVARFIINRVSTHEVRALIAPSLMRLLRERNPEELLSLCAVVGLFADELSDDEIARIAAFLLERLDEQPEVRSKALVIQAAAMFGGALEDRDVVPLVRAILEGVQSETDGFVLGSLGRAATELALKMEPGDVSFVAARLIERGRSESDRFKRASMLGAVAGLVKFVRPGDISTRDLLHLIMENAEKSPSVSTLSRRLFGGLGENLSDEAATRLALALIAEISNGVDGPSLVVAAEALAGLGPHLTRDNRVTAAFHLLVSRACQERDADSLEALVSAMVALRPALESPVDVGSWYREPVSLSQLYVDLLKTPLMSDRVRGILLKALVEETGGEVGENESAREVLWSFVDRIAAAGNGQTLDLTARPKWMEGPESIY